MLLKKLNDFRQRKKQLEENLIPFVEPNSIEEELVFNELFYVNNQIDAIISYMREREVM